MTSRVRVRTEAERMDLADRLGPRALLAQLDDVLQRKPWQAGVVHGARVLGADALLRRVRSAPRRRDVPIRPAAMPVRNAAEMPAFLSVMICSTGKLPYPAATSAARKPPGRGAGGAGGCRGRRRGRRCRRLRGIWRLCGRCGRRAALEPQRAPEVRAASGGAAALGGSGRGRRILREGQPVRRLGKRQPGRNSSASTENAIRVADAFAAKTRLPRSSISMRSPRCDARVAIPDASSIRFRPAA